jgi:hypothetical protein
VDIITNEHKEINCLQATKIAVVETEIKYMKVQIEEIHSAIVGDYGIVKRQEEFEKEVYSKINELERTQTKFLTGILIFKWLAGSGCVLGMLTFGVSVLMFLSVIMK